MSRLEAVRGLAPLHHRDFRRLAAGQLASNVGDSFYAVALPWYVLAAHGGAVLLGTVLVAYGVPRAALVVVGGHLSDRWRPWTVMMSTDAARAVAAAGLAFAAAMGPARAVVLVPIAAVLGAGAGLFLPGSFAIIPALLPEEDLQAGNALISGGTQLSLLAGPAAGGALVALLGPAPALALDAASFIVSMATLAAIRAARGSVRPVLPVASHATDAAGASQAQEGSPSAGQSSQAQAGSPSAGQSSTGAPASPSAGQPGTGAAPTLWSVLRSERAIQIGLLVSVAANLGSGGTDEVALPSLAHGQLHAGAAGYGALIAAFGAGALAGTIAAAQARPGRRPAIVASVMFLVEAVALAAVPYLGGTLPAGAALVVTGVTNGFGNIVMITAFQRWAPPDLLGRLAGLMTLASFGVFPVSVALAALVVHHLGPAPFFPLGAAGLAIAILAGLSQRAWRSFGAGTDHANRTGPAARQRVTERPAALAEPPHRG